MEAALAVGLLLALLATVALALRVSAHKRALAAAMERASTAEARVDDLNRKVNDYSVKLTTSSRP